MDNKTNAKKRRLGVLDYFIIIVLILCVAGIALRFIFKLNKPEDKTFAHVESETYYVQYISRSQRNVVDDFLKEGTEFRFFGTNEPFGTSFAVPDSEPAEKRYVNSKGEQILVRNTSDDDRTDKEDLRGKFVVKGKLSEDGVLLVDGSNNIISLNKEYTVRSDFLVFSFTVTGITPAK